ncbi:MAG: VanZ family protein [Myxococcales bacterium]|nr:VanZ family protein [Myxococcales bacterium]
MMRWGLGLHLGAALTIVAAAYLGLLPIAIQRLHVHADKVLHFLIIGGVAFWLVGVWDDARLTLGSLRLPLAVLVPLSIAGIEEMLQTFSPRRNADPLDFLADLLGLVAFYLVGRWLVASRKPQGPPERPSVA